MNDYWKKKVRAQKRFMTKGCYGILSCTKSTFYTQQYTVRHNNVSVNNVG